MSMTSLEAMAEEYRKELPQEKQWMADSYLENLVAASQYVLTVRPYEEVTAKAVAESIQLMAQWTYQLGEDNWTEEDKALQMESLRELLGTESWVPSAWEDLRDVSPMTDYLLAWDDRLRMLVNLLEGAKMESVPLNWDELEMEPFSLRMESLLG